MAEQKIKILHIQETMGSGGVERRRLSLAKYLDKEIFEQKFICTLTKGNIPEEIRAEGFDVIVIGQLKSPYHRSQHKKVQKIIEENKQDSVHGDVFEGVTMAAINGLLKKVPVVIIEETSFPLYRTWKGNLLMKLFSKIATKVIGVSPATSEEYLKGKLNLSDKKVVLINNGVAIPREVSPKELEKAKEEYGILENDFVIGSTGRMLQDSNKRFSDLIKAFAEFSKGKESVKLLLVGDGPEKEGYQNLAKDSGVSDKVIFAGYQSDVSLFYRMMDVFSLVSTHESFGLVLAEAMLNKLPVIATRVGGMKYIVENQETGFLVEPLQIQEIKEKMEILYLDGETRKRLGNNGFEKANREYTEDSYVNSIQDLYLSLVNKS